MNISINKRTPFFNNYEYSTKSRHAATKSQMTGWTGGRCGGGLNFLPNQSLLPWLGVEGNFGFQKLQSWISQGFGSSFYVLYCLYKNKYFIYRLRAYLLWKIFCQTSKAWDRNSPYNLNRVLLQSPLEKKNKLDQSKINKLIHREQPVTTEKEPENMKFIHELKHKINWLLLLEEDFKAMFI